MKIIEQIRKLMAYYKFKRAIELSEKMAYESGRTYYILNVGGRLEIFSVSKMRKFLEYNRKNKPKGYDLEAMKRQALYVTARQFEKNKQKQVKK